VQSESLLSVLAAGYKESVARDALGGGFVADFDGDL